MKNKIINSPMDFFHEGTDCTSKLTNVTLNRDNIEEAIKDMATNSSPGPDHFPAVLLKRCAKELNVSLLSLYIFSLESSLIPKQLKSANITPIHKGESKTEAKNYPLPTLLKSKRPTRSRTERSLGNSIVVQLA